MVPTCLPSTHGSTQLRGDVGLGLKLLETVNAHLVGRGLMMRQGTMVDATILNAPSSTKNKQGERDTEMHRRPPKFE
ncbi:hypothetical protein BVV20_03230 [Xanthomonas oryzae pv. oryzae]|nr:hypothetical protein BVV20_03230 [Xanthomonas oryzae pv. oryzae]